MIHREIHERIARRLFSGKAIILFGPRQSGKTTLVQMLLAGRDDVLHLNGDEADVRALLEQPSSQRLQSLIGNCRIVFIDEAQRIEGIGLTLKLLVDNFADVQVIATGSSALELARRAHEPLTGRKWDFHLFPFSFAELVANDGLLEERRRLPVRLVYGAYPEIVTHQGDEEERVRLLASSYLYKDILSLGVVQKPHALEKLLRALALQVGSEVSFNELAGLVGISATTAETYIDLLEKTDVVFQLPAFARNVRNEIRKSRKFYFVDNGIRNAVIGNFQPVESRTDKGALLENYLISERRKRLFHHGIAATGHFWRTTQQQEIDYVEELDGALHAYEFKWNDRARPRVPVTFSKAYPDAATKLVTPGNYDGFLL